MHAGWQADRSHHTPRAALDPVTSGILAHGDEAVAYFVGPLSSAEAPISKQQGKKKPGRSGREREE